MTNQHEDKIDLEAERALYEAAISKREQNHDAWRVRQARAALARKAQEPESVPIPTSVNMARLMLALSYKWLKENAPQHVPAQEPSIPDGYALVPIEPTDDMKDAPEVKVGGCYSCSPEQVGWSACAEIYRAMIAAAGVAPQEPAVKQGWISTDERLPENGVDVIILYWPYDNHENDQVAGSAHHVEGTFYDEDGNDMHAPSHWMPLNPPAKEPSHVPA